MRQKKWYKSKMLWVNLIALLSVFGFEITTEEATAILAVVNIALRLITKEELIW